MTDRDSLEDELVGAFRDAQPAVSTPPPIGELVARHQVVVRRRIAGATVAVVLVIGLGGVWAATSRSGPQPPSASSSADLDRSKSPTSGPFECSGPLGSDGTTWRFESCVSVSDGSPPGSPLPTTTTSIVPMSVPTTTIAPFPTVAVPDGFPLPDVGDATEAPVDEVVPPATTTTSIVPSGPSAIEVLYELRQGDTPMSVATAFCVSVEALLAYNAIDDVETAPWFVGTTLRIPPAGGCPPGPTTTAVAAPSATTGS